MSNVAGKSFVLLGVWVAVALTAIQAIHLGLPITSSLASLQRLDPSPSADNAIHSFILLIGGGLLWLRSLAFDLGVGPAINAAERVPWPAALAVVTAGILLRTLFRSRR